MIPKLGQIVFYKDEPLDGLKESAVWPAIIHRVFPDHDYVGIHVFKETGIFKFNKVNYGDVPLTWNFLENGFKEVEVK